MTTTTTTTTPGGSGYSASVEATRRTREGSDKWSIADALLSEVGPGEARSGFNSVTVACEESGVRPYSVSAMRQYRDVAARWPEALRIPGVSFSAHRAALPASDPESLLRGLVQVHGVEVPVRVVAEAVRVANGGVAAMTSPTASADLGTSALGDIAGELSRRLKHRRDEVVAELGTRTWGTVFVELAEIVRTASAESAKKAAAWGGEVKSTTPAPEATPESPRPLRRRGLRA